MDHLPNTGGHYHTRSHQPSINSSGSEEQYGYVEVKAGRRTRWRAPAVTWNRKVHPHNLTTTNTHTDTYIPHVERTVRLVDLATEIVGPSSSTSAAARTAPLACRVRVHADFPD